MCVKFVVLIFIAFVRPVDATLLKIDDPVEDYCKSIGYWSISVLNSTIESMRYEVQIAKITAAYHLTDDKFFGFWKDFCNINVFKDIELMEAKLPDYEIPNPAGVKMIQDLLFRAKLRSWAPRIAIKAIESLSDGYLFHLHPQFTPEKWKKLQKLIPEGYKNYLNFYLDSETGYKLKFTVTSLLSKFTALQVSLFYFPRACNSHRLTDNYVL